MVHIWACTLAYMYGIYLFNWFSHDLAVSMGDVVNNSPCTLQ